MLDMWPWKKKKEKKDDEIKEPDEHELMLREMERELDRMMPGMGRMFRELERELERTMPEMLRMMEQMMAEMQKSPEGQPVFRGIRIVIGPDGIPRVEEFGNVRKTPDGRPRIAKYREPLVDVIERDDEVIITAELPGVEKKDITVSVDGKIVEIRAEGEGPFKYQKAIGLKGFVDPKTSKAVFNNGILEITAKKASRPGKGKIKVN